MTPDAQRRIVGALYGCPNGVMRMSDSVPGLVETSTNLGLASAADGTFSAGFLVRSAVNSARDDVEQMASQRVRRWPGSTRCARTRSRAGNRTRTRPSSPSCSRSIATCGATTPRSWPCTPVSKRASSVPPYPGLDMISVGPTIEHVHSPDERLEIASVGKVYDLLVATLQRIPANPSGSASPTERTPGGCHLG